MHDLAIIIVSHNDAAWLQACLSSIYQRAEGIELDVVVVDNGTDAAAAFVEQEFPKARALRLPNRGFGNANNRGLRTCSARYVLFLNPDTEIIEGSFSELIATMDARPTVGLAGVVQVGGDGSLQPSIRRFPNALRAFGEAIGSERVGLAVSWLGERELDASVYAREVECDWTSGSFMLARHEALESAGSFDERFFVFGEEPDLCLRIKRAGWSIRHLPVMTIIHHAERAGLDARREALNAHARVLHANKHFSLLHRQLFMAALVLRYGLRALAPDRDAAGRRAAAKRALRTIVKLDTPPIEADAPVAIPVGED